MKNPTAAQTKTYGPYLYGKIPFQPGMLYDHLTASQYDIVVGLDFGHGETVAYKYYLEPDTKSGGKKPVYRNVKMDYKGSAAIPTYIHCDASGRVVIGKEAADESGFHQHFKQSPKRWDTPVGGRTARELMRDFIGTLWQSILIYDDTIKEALANGTLLLAVGCPSGGDWTTEESMRAYGELVREATGCAYVEIFPESAAAIMANIHSVMMRTGEDQPGYTGCGVAIYDFGSSTLDFTYVYMGRVIFNLSVDLGGSQIDEAMLRKLLADNGLTEGDIPAGQRDSVLAQIRGHKEDFYPREKLSRLLVNLTSTDEDDENLLDCLYVLNKDFMHEVLWEDRKIHIRNETYRNRGLSWGECCREFVADTCKLISQYPCEAVVLTGGTSFVTDTVEICRDTYKKAFPNAAFSPEADRGVSVAKGLCYAKSVESRSAEEIGTVRNSLKTAFRKEYDQLLKNVAESIFDEIWAVTSGVYAELAQDGQPHHKDEINIRIDSRIHYSEALNERIGQVYGIHLRESLSSCQEVVLEKVNGLSKTIYNTALENLPQLPPITDIDVENVMHDLTIGKLYLTVPLQEIAEFIRVLLWLPDAWVDKAGNVSHDRLMEIVRERQDDAKKEKSRKKNVRDIEKSLRKDGDLRADFDARVDEQFEIALGKITFLLYEQKENT